MSTQSDVGSDKKANSIAQTTTTTSEITTTSSSSSPIPTTLSDVDEEGYQLFRVGPSPAAALETKNGEVDEAPPSLFETAVNGRATDNQPFALSETAVGDIASDEVPSAPLENPAAATTSADRATYEEIFAPFDTTAAAHFAGDEGLSAPPLNAAAGSATGGVRLDLFEIAPVNEAPEEETQTAASTEVAADDESKDELPSVPSDARVGNLPEDVDGLEMIVEKTHSNDEFFVDSILCISGLIFFGLVLICTFVSNTDLTIL